MRYPSLLLSLLLALMATPLRANTNNTLADLGLKATRYFDQKEWASASAMYSLLLDQRPDSAMLYGRAVAAAAMRGDDSGETALLRQALGAKVPLDSLFSSVRQACFSIGNAHLYEHFLLLSGRSEPWLSRKTDAMLLDYYTFRRDGAAMVTYARKLLAGMPDSRIFALRLAEGLLIEGRDAEARDTLASLVATHPDSFEALLYLGEMALYAGDSAAATDYLARARAIRATPRLDALLSRHP